MILDESSFSGRIVMEALCKSKARWFLLGKMTETTTEMTEARIGTETEIMTETGKEKEDQGLMSVD